MATLESCRYVIVRLKKPGTLYNVQHDRSARYDHFKMSLLSRSKSQNLVEMLDSVGETCPVPMGCGFEGEEHIKLVHTPV